MAGRNSARVMTLTVLNLVCELFLYACIALWPPGIPPPRATCLSYRRSATRATGAFRILSGSLPMPGGTLGGDSLGRRGCPSRGRILVGARKAPLASLILQPKELRETIAEVFERPRPGREWNRRLFVVREKGTVKWFNA